MTRESTTEIEDGKGVQGMVVGSNGGGKWWRHGMVVARNGGGKEWRQDRSVRP